MVLDEKCSSSCCWLLGSTIFYSIGNAVVDCREGRIGCQSDQMSIFEVAYHSCWRLFQISIGPEVALMHWEIVRAALAIVP